MLLPSLRDSESNPMTETPLFPDPCPPRKPRLRSNSSMVDHAPAIKPVDGAKKLRWVGIPPLPLRVSDTSVSSRSTPGQVFTNHPPVRFEPRYSILSFADKRSKTRRTERVDVFISRKMASSFMPGLSGHFRGLSGHFRGLSGHFSFYRATLSCHFRDGPAR